MQVHGHGHGREHGHVQEYESDQEHDKEQEHNLEYDQGVDNYNAETPMLNKILVYNRYFYN